MFVGTDAANHAEIGVIIDAALRGEMTGALARRMHALGAEATVAFALATLAAERAPDDSAVDAAWIGSYLHGLAADFAAEQVGETSLLAGDVIRYLPAAFRALNETEEETPDSHSHHD